MRRCLPGGTRCRGWQAEDGHARGVCVCVCVCVCVGDGGRDRAGDEGALAPGVPCRVRVTPSESARVRFSPYLGRPAVHGRRSGPGAQGAVAQPPPATGADSRGPSGAERRRRGCVGAGTSQKPRPVEAGGVGGGGGHGALWACLRPQLQQGQKMVRHTVVWAQAAWSPSRLSLS